MKPLTIEDLNLYANLKQTIIDTIGILEDEDIKLLNNKEDYESLIRHCSWIVKDAKKDIDKLKKDEILEVRPFY